jgi:hypothetical protein
MTSDEIHERLATVKAERQASRPFRVRLLIGGRYVTVYGNTDYTSQAQAATQAKMILRAGSEKITAAAVFQGRKLVERVNRE